MSLEVEEGALKYRTPLYKTQRKKTEETEKGHLFNLPSKTLNIPFLKRNNVKA